MVTAAVDENLEPIDGLGVTVSSPDDDTATYRLPAGGPLTTDGRRELRTAALVVGWSALAGLPVGLVWWLVAPLPRIAKRADGLYRAGGEGNEAAIAADGWFAVLAVLAGVVIALVVYLLTRPGRVLPLVGLAVGGLLGAVVAWRFGALLGRAPIEATARGLEVGARFDGPLDVSALGVLLAWPLAAVITYFAVSAGSETGDPLAGRTTCRRGRRRSDAAASASPADRRSPSPGDLQQVGGREPHLQAAPPGGHVDRAAVRAPSRRRRPGSRLRWPIGLMPPTTYPVARSASAGSAIAAFLPPIAAASALRSSVPLTGTTAVTSRAVDPGDQRLEDLVVRQAEGVGGLPAVRRCARRVLVREQRDLDPGLRQGHRRGCPAAAGGLRGLSSGSPGRGSAPPPGATAAGRTGSSPGAAAPARRAAGRPCRAPRAAAAGR